MWGNPEVALRTPHTGPALRLQGTGLHHGLPWRATPQEVHVPPTPQPADGSGFKAGSHTAHPPSTSHPHTASCPARPWGSVRPALWRPSEGPLGDFTVLAKSSASCKPRAAASIRLAQRLTQLPLQRLGTRFASSRLATRQSQPSTTTSAVGSTGLPSG